MKSVFNQRHDIPSLGNAFLCCISILMLKFFIGFAAAAIEPNSFLGLTQITLAVLLAGVLAPALIMAIMLTTNVWKTLKLSRCSIPVACAAAIMAICFHPALMALTSLVMTIYPPIGDASQMSGMFENIMGSAPGFWAGQPFLWNGSLIHPTVNRYGICRHHPRCHRSSDPQYYSLHDLPRYS